MGTVSAAWMFLACLFLWKTQTESKVYYDCGAVLNPAGKDLILSPGFPNNYLSGSHCLWQIFVPAGSSIEMETLDFDIYESSGDDIDFATSVSSSDSLSSPTGSVDHTYLPNQLKMIPRGHNNYPNEASNHIITPEKWKKVNDGMKTVLKSQDLIGDQSPSIQVPKTPQKELLSTVTESSDDPIQDYNRPINHKASTSRMATIFSQQVSEGATSSPINIGTDPLTTFPPVLEVCPFDVLYITDLVTYSSRFCGSNSLLNKNLTFGSPVEMIEVVLELITTTNRGRGFALLFTYHNQSLATTMAVQASQGRESVVLLAVIAAAISFALVLLLVLCLSYRQKICPKREQSDSQVTAQVNGIQNTGLDVNELHLVVAEDLQNRALEAVIQAPDVSQQMHQEEPTLSTFTATDSNSDEVFVISAGNNTDCFMFNTYVLQEGNLKRSVTSPAAVCDWLTSEYTSVDLNVDEKASEIEEADEARQRTWSTRTFNSLLPQLQMKWRSRSSSGSFTKLVDSSSTTPVKGLNIKSPRRVGSAVQIGENSTYLFSESDSNASYPLTQSAQLQRKLPSCNLKRTRPYFGLLNDFSDCVQVGHKPLNGKENNPCQTSAMEYTGLCKMTSGNGVRAKELSKEYETPNTVFVISEEADDQQPLVFEDHLSPATEALSINHNGYQSDDCYLESTNHSHISPWMHSLGDSNIQSLENKISLSLTQNLSSHCTAVAGRQSPAVCANFPSTPLGLVTE
ncbi:uncharacterized protein [Hyperolius riggenbachi]|uniref:uncharacterized protein isoform X2 n=1 Tax=Hyperolius riggenbachi TaxID=752182 RepID=UPI0035A3D0DD